MASLRQDAQTLGRWDATSERACRQPSNSMMLGIPAEQGLRVDGRGGLPLRSSVVRGWSAGEW